MCQSYWLVFSFRSTWSLLYSKQWQCQHWADIRCLLQQLTNLILLFTNSTKDTISFVRPLCTTPNLDSDHNFVVISLTLYLHFSKRNGSEIFEIKSGEVRCSANWPNRVQSKPVWPSLSFHLLNDLEDQHPLKGVNLSVPGVGHSTKCNGMGEIMTNQNVIWTQIHWISSQVLYQGHKYLNIRKMVTNNTFNFSKVNTFKVIVHKLEPF